MIFSKISLINKRIKIMIAPIKIIIITKKIKKTIQQAKQTPLIL